MELEYINELLSKGNLTSHNLHEWLREHPLMPEEKIHLLTGGCHLSGVINITKKPQEVNNDVCNQSDSHDYVRNKESFLTKYINNNNSHNENNNSNKIKTIYTPKCNAKQSPIKRKNARKTVCNSKAPFREKKKFWRAISVPAFGFRKFSRKSSSCSLQIKEQKQVMTKKGMN